MLFRTDPIKVTSRLEERINARWLTWIPWSTAAARKRLPFLPVSQSLGEARRTHRERYLESLRYRIPERTILRWSLDDPRPNAEEYRTKLEHAMKRQRINRAGRDTHADKMRQKEQGEQHANRI